MELTDEITSVRWDDDRCIFYERFTIHLESIDDEFVPLLEILEARLESLEIDDIDSSSILRIFRIHIVLDRTIHPTIVHTLILLLHLALGSLGGRHARAQVSAKISELVSDDTESFICLRTIKLEKVDMFIESSCSIFGLREHRDDIGSEDIRIGVDREHILRYESLLTFDGMGEELGDGDNIL